MAHNHIAEEHLRINAANEGKWFTLDFESYLTALYANVLRSGMIAVDCGANLGLHALRMASAVSPGGLVVAIEPIGELVARLRQEAQDRKVPVDLLRILQCGVSNQSGSADFYQVDDDVQHGVSGLRLRHYAPGIIVKTVPVELTTLDAICADLPRLDFVKLDIEGAEFDALRGGVNTLRRFRPVITIEQAQSDPGYFGYNWQDLLSQFSAMDYDLYDLFGLEYTRVEHLQDCMLWDFVAMPREYTGRNKLFDAVRNYMIEAGVKGLNETAQAEPHGASQRPNYEGWLVRKPGSHPLDQKVYFVENGYKRWVTTLEWITSNGMKWPSDVRIVSTEEVDLMPSGLPLP